VWDVTVAQPGPLGILVDFLNAPFPGCAAAYNGMAYLDWWATDPFHFGAYSYYQRGQYTQFAGYEKVRKGNIHFCYDSLLLNVRRGCLPLDSQPPPAPHWSELSARHGCRGL
jgi:hypothetical protein